MTSAASLHTPWEFFNETVVQFVDDLKLVFPNDPILAFATIALNMVTRAKQTALQDAFNRALSPYKSRVLARDESFFMEHTVSEYKIDYKRMKNGTSNDGFALTDLKAAGKKLLKGSSSPSIFTDIIEALKGKWKNMSAENKDVIWQYMIQLSNLNDTCLAVSAADAV